MLNQKKSFSLMLATLLLSACASDPEVTFSDRPSTQIPTITKSVDHSQGNLPKSQTTQQTVVANAWMPSEPDNLPPANYHRYPEVQSFIQQMVSKHGFSQTYLENLFAEASRLESVIHSEMGDTKPSGPPKPHVGSWSRYRAVYLTEEHIQDGVQFWRANANVLQKASVTYGVDPEYIVGIIGVETYFGKNLGKVRVFDSLTTLAFDTPRRAKYFKTELENFLLMTREESYAPRSLVGSWAGAMGLGQFMPSSFRRLAIDFDHNGRRDLWQPHDAIGSVAHYFSRSGWEYNSPVADQVNGPQGDSVIDLSTYEGDEYWQTYHNFKVIKRYNNSKKYAMAVHQLAQAIKQRI